MRIFEKRPLSLILCIMLGGFSFFICADISITLSVICLCAAITLCIILFFKAGKKRKVFPLICLIAFALSVLLSFIWQQSFFPVDHYGRTVEIEGCVTYAEHESANVRFEITTNKIDGASESRKLSVYATREQLSGINRGDTIIFSAAVNELENNDFQSFDSRSYLISKGICAIASVTDGTVPVIKGHGGFSLSNFFDDSRIHITSQLKLLTNENTGAFLSALITGDRQTLDGNTELNFKRIGISHILALSGTHLALLSALLLKIFRLIRLNKKISVCLSAVFSLFYMALTGMSPSITRSGIMVILAAIMFLITGSKDAITSLFISVFLIILFNPHSVFDISLWLSAFATLGVLFYSEITDKSKKPRHFIVKALIYLKEAFLISVFAIIATFTVTLLSFGEFSLVSTISTVIFSFLVEILIYIGLLALLFGNIIPIGNLAIAFSNFIKGLAERFSSLEYVYVPQDSILIKSIMIFLLVFFLGYMLIGKKSHKLIATVVISVVFIILNLVGLLSSINLDNKELIEFTPSNSSDVLLIKSDGCIALIPSGVSGGAQYSVRDILSENNILYIDKLILPSYSYSDLTFFRFLLSGFKIHTVYLPAPRTTADMHSAKGIAKLISGYSAILEFYYTEEELAIGKAEFSLLQNGILSEHSYTQNIYRVTYMDSNITYVSAGVCDVLTQPEQRILIDTDILIVGANGAESPKSFYPCLNNIKAIIFGEDLPLTPECDSFYNEKGASRIFAKDSVKLFEE